MELFADLSNLRFSWVDKVASGVVCEIRLVVFESNKGFTFGSGAFYPAI